MSKRKLPVAVGCLSALIFIFSFSLPAIAREVSPKTVAAISQQSALNFVENKGQVLDQNGKQREDIQFKLVTGNNLNIFIGNGQIHYQWNKNSTSQNTKGNGLKTNDLRLTTEAYRMDVELLGANKQAEVIAEEKQEYSETYYTAPFTPTNGSTVHSYKKITYRNVYPNIDWVLHISNNTSLSIGEGRGEVTYDFVVHPGGNISDIQLQYSGANSIVLNPDGGLSAVTPLGGINEASPYSYESETGTPVATVFNLEQNRLTFNIDPRSYNKNNTLVIDPPLQWATYYGGSDDDEGLTSCYDGAGYIYIAGYTSSSSNIATAGSHQNTYAGSVDVFLAKFNSSGTRIWATYYGGLGTEQAWGVACDGSANVYITGVTSSASNISTPGAYQTAIGGSPNDAYLAKFNSSGSLQWATYYGGSGSGQVFGYAVSCDGSGNVFFDGWTNCTVNVASSGAYQTSFAGGAYDAFLVKFNGAGARQWATYYGGSSFDQGKGVTCDGSGNVYMTGITNSTSAIATSGSYQTSNGGGVYDAFLVKFNGSGSIQWGTYYGGSGDDEAYGLTYDGVSNVYLVGQTSSTGSIASSGAYQSTYGGGDYDAFLAKFSLSGSRAWATYYGGSDSDYAYSVAIAPSGNVFFAGTTTSPSNIATSASYQTTLGGTQDAYIAQFSNLGSRLWATYFGGSGVDAAMGIACDASDNVYLSGYTTSTSNVATAGSFQTNFGGGSHDAFLVKFKADTAVYCLQPFIDTVKCAGDTINIGYTVNFPFYSGNTFTVQLSNALGSFSSAVNIGSVSATTAGTVACTIPASTPNGTGYRIRIIGSSPIDTSADEGVNIHVIKIANPVTTNNSPICLGDTLKITLTDTTSGVSYSWAGPNSYSSTSQNITIANTPYVDSGNYIATISLSSCQLRDTLHVNVKTLPVTPSASSNSPVCANTTLNLSASSTTPGVTYSWTGPNSFSSTVQNPSISPVLLLDSGYYIVKATLNGCKSADTIHITVKPVAAAPTITNNSPICYGDTLKITSATTTSGVTYSWLGPNSYSSTSQNITKPNAAYTDSGNYYLTIALNGCNKYDTVHVTIKQLPTTPSAASNSPVCANTSLNLTSSSTTPGVSYSWTGPNSFSSATQNPTINPVLLIDSGYYIVKAILSGCTSADTIHVTVKAGLALPTTTNNTPICAGDTLRLTSNSTTSGVSYSWTGPNSFSSTSQNVTINNVTTANAGNYYLTVSVNGCSVLDTLIAVINPKPNTPTMTSNSPVCTNTTLNLTSNSTTPSVTYSWTGPNSFSSTVQNPAVASVVMTDSGYYFVTATLNGCSSKDSIHVVVTHGPDSVYANNNSPICSGDSLNVFSGSATAGVSYSWSGPNSFTSALANFSIANAQTINGGSYYLTVSLNGCNVHDTMAVTIHQTPALPVASSNSPVCVGSNLVLTSGSSTPGVSYSWTGPAGFTSGTQNPVVSSVTAANAGEYVVTATLSGCSSKDSTLVAISPVPVAPLVSSNSPLCAGDTLKLTGADGTPGVSYQWSGPGSYISTTQNPKLPNITTANAGTYTLTASLSGCSASATTTVVINPVLGAPTVHITASPGDTVCSGATITFTATVTNAVSTSYQWKVNAVNVAGATNSTYATATLNNLDVVTCYITSNAPCQLVNSAYSNPITMHIGSLPAPVVSVTKYPLVYTNGQLVTFTGHVPAGNNTLSYQWTKNGANIAGANTLVYATKNITPSDTICLVVTSSVPCTIPAVTCTELTTGIGNLSAAEHNFKVYPNPNTGSFTISAEIDFEVTVDVVNALGQTLYQQSIAPVNGILNKQVELNAAPGLYLLRVSGSGGSMSLPLVISR